MLCRRDFPVPIPLMRDGKPAYCGIASSSRNLRSRYLRDRNDKKKVITMVIPQVVGFLVPPKAGTS